MEYLGNIWISLIVVIVFYMLFLVCFCVTKTSEKGLGIIDLIWQIALVLGVIFATSEVSKFQNSWQYERNLSYTESWYDKAVSELNWSVEYSSQLYERGNLASWNNVEDFKKAQYWFLSYQDTLISYRSRIIEVRDTMLWNKTYAGLQIFIDTNNSILKTRHQTVL